MHRIQNQGNRNHDNKKKDIDTYDALVQKYAQPIPCKSWRHCCSESLPIVQEFALVVFFLARFQLSVQWQAANLRHRKLLEERLDNGHACILLGFCLVIILRLLCQRQRQPRNRQQTQMKATKAPSRLVMKDSRTKARHRLTDACLLGVLLRLLASVLRRLTASYSTDTVEALTIAAMALHLLTCDYTYSSSIPDTTTTTVPSSSISSSSSSSSLPQLKRNRPPFRGGTVSLNASFFATVLCISRLESDLTSYFFCSLAVICFGFYPQSRAELMQEYPPRSSAPMWWVSVSLIMAAYLLIESTLWRRYYCFAVAILMFILPSWRYASQSFKVRLDGPWSLPTNLLESRSGGCQRTEGKY